MHHADQRLAGREATDDLLAERGAAHRVDEVLYDRQRDVGLEQRDANFAQRILDIRFGEARSPRTCLTMRAARGQVIKTVGVESVINWGSARHCNSRHRLGHVRRPGLALLETRWHGGGRAPDPGRSAACAPGSAPRSWSRPRCTAGCSTTAFLPRACAWLRAKRSR